MAASRNSPREGDYLLPIPTRGWQKPRLGRRFTRKLSKATDPAIVDSIKENAQDIVENGYKYYVTKNVWYDFKNVRVCVPQGFLTDGASGPGWDSLDEECWILHDFLYATHNTSADRKGLEVSKEEADTVLDLPWRRKAVELFGQPSWDSSGKRGPQFLSW